MCWEMVIADIVADIREPVAFAQFSYCYMKSATVDRAVLDECAGEVLDATKQGGRDYVRPVQDMLEHAHNTV